MRQQHAEDLAERRDGDAVENVVTVIEQNLGDADERGVQLVAAEQFGEARGRGEDNLVLNAARERDGIEIFHRADSERRERPFEAGLTFAAGLDPFALQRPRDVLRRFWRDHAQFGDVVRRTHAATNLR